MRASATARAGRGGRSDCVRRSGLVAVALLDDAIGRRQDVLVDGDGTDAVGRDVAGRGVLDVRDAAAYVGLQGGIFERTIARGVERAVFQHEAVRVAQGLFAGDVAVHQAQVARMPAQVFAVQLRVVDGHVLHLPESILGRYPGVADFRIPDVLEHVFAVALQSVDIDVGAEHEGVGTPVQFEVVYAQAVATPEHFVGVIHPDAFHVDVAHLAEHLGRVDYGVGHAQVVGVPQGRASADGEVTMFDGEPVDVPERIVALKAAVGGHDVGTLFDGRLSGQDGHVVQVEVVRGEQGTFASELGVFYQLHVFLVFVRCKDTAACRDSG